MAAIILDPCFFSRTWPLRSGRLRNIARHRVPIRRSNAMTVFVQQFLGFLSARTVSIKLKGSAQPAAAGIGIGRPHRNRRIDQFSRPQGRLSPGGLQELPGLGMFGIHGQDSRQPFQERQYVRFLGRRHPLFQQEELMPRRGLDLVEACLQCLKSGRVGRGNRRGTQPRQPYPRPGPILPTQHIRRLLDRGRDVGGQLGLRASGPSLHFAAMRTSGKPFYEPLRLAPKLEQPLFPPL